MLDVLACTGRVLRDEALARSRSSRAQHRGKRPSTRRSPRCSQRPGLAARATGTIGLLMDCDTTGIEPDLGLVKFKKLVGGGNMAIVNQTLPRALRKLGTPRSSPWPSRPTSTRTIDRGRPGPSPEHLPVFACSMGDNTIHYLGHVKMMGAVQPFIFGRDLQDRETCPRTPPSKTWRPAHGRLEIGREGRRHLPRQLQGRQPLSTAKKTASPPRRSPRPTRSRPNWSLAIEQLKLELEVARSESHHVTIQALRRGMPRRRVSTTFAFRVATAKATSRSVSTRTVDP